MHDQPISTFPERLRVAMTHAGDMSQSELARLVGVKPQSIQYLLNSANEARGSRYIASIARALNVSPDWLATGRGNMLDRVLHASSATPMEFGTPSVKVTPPPALWLVIDLLAYSILQLPERSRADVAPHLQALCLAPDSDTLKKKLIELLEPTYPK